MSSHTQKFLATKKLPTPKKKIHTLTRTIGDTDRLLLIGKLLAGNLCGLGWWGDRWEWERGECSVNHRISQANTRSQAHGQRGICR